MGITDLNDLDSLDVLGGEVSLGGSLLLALRLRLSLVLSLGGSLLLALRLRLFLVLHLGGLLDDGLGDLDGLLLLAGGVGSAHASADALVVVVVVSLGESTVVSGSLDLNSLGVDVEVGVLGEQTSTVVDLGLGFEVDGGNGAEEESCDDEEFHYFNLADGLKKRLEL